MASVLVIKAPSEIPVDVKMPIVLYVSICSSGVIYEFVYDVC